MLARNNILKHFNSIILNSSNKQNIFIYNTINNNNSNYNKSRMHFSTLINNNRNEEDNDVNKFFKDYIYKSTNYSLEQKKKLIESFVLDSQGSNKISKEKIRDINISPISSDILESFIKIRDDLEKYNCLPITTTTTTNTNISPSTPTNRLSEQLYSFDTLLGELIKENLKNHNKLYCKPLDLEKMEPRIWRQIVENEAVHPYENPLNPIDEIKQRTGKNRTCLVLFHPLLPNMPLMSLYIAFTNGIPNNMQIIENNNPSTTTTTTTNKINDNDFIDSAIFYSISSLHKGLGGVNLGHILITKAVEFIRLDKPEIKNFCTLSPLPRFRKYLSKSHPQFVEHIKDRASLEEVKPQLQSLALNYIFKEKSKPNRVFDPVCNFHLKNGASIYRLNWDADESEKRIDESYGIMINYLYEIEKLESNSKNYIEKGTVSTNQIFDNQYKNNSF
ncbi:hypothetical protein RB653_009201 [Dictyostelium firmibasis]|uniref:Malonyl-CoA decarboxylase C-terminal domain-containing protein n=1 Tax=Dictyostelium firmibasis TaxID=79012 RepID=A0AAN7YX66_9MYCE